ncbi:hypothetical protein FRACYDRAFT_252596 [Fragilariopsis cylindrus CCMP1102]|uniref:Uncharacterized protein n=1 Tax=Fragilariopsis cylindrus CCMP1102 TaxID=635003 RepID=A0A1E7EM49_9STRA|nr:hypothetical protein FRACYDRAFT_252596 [Fragilariopsis cylindrus CCMP1102]|eukprot:OEU06964.1 hypothetical protein FRACYDRAFT_252596 [Fragilariopsis cylindrus CCMP1102]
MPNNTNGGVVVNNVLPVLTSRFLALPQQQNQQSLEEDQQKYQEETVVVAKQKQQQDELLQLVTSMTAAAAQHIQTESSQTEEEVVEEDCFANLPTNLFAEEEEARAPPLPVAVAVNQLMIVSPGNSRTGNNNYNSMLWASDSFNTNSIIHVDPDRRLSCPLPNSITMIDAVAAAVAVAPHPPPTTPRRSHSGGGGGCGSSGLFPSFSSGTPTSEMSPSMWQYGAAGAASSPRTTDAVEASAWMQQDNSMAMIPLAPPPLTYGAAAAAAVINGAINANATTGLPPLPQLPPVIDGIPTMIRCYCDYMDDEVSVLADDPEDDDDNVLPNTTYDVLANTGIFAEEGEDD